MKAVVLTLALLFLTGSQAQHETQQEEPPTQWERVKALAQVYVNSAKASGREYIVKFEETDLAKKLNLTVLEKLNTLGNKVTELQKLLGPPTQTFWAKLKKEVGMLTGELNKDLTEVMKPYQEGIQKKWKERVEPLAQDLRETLQKQLQKLQEKLVQLGEKVLGSVRNSDYVLSLSVVLQSFRDELRECLEPCKGKLRECLEPNGGKLRECLEPNGGKLRECLEPCKDKLREHLQALGEGGTGLAKLREHMEPTLAEMHKDLQPLWESLQDAFLPFLYGIDIDDISQRLTGQ